MYQPLPIKISHLVIYSAESTKDQGSAWLNQKQKAIGSHPLAFVYTQSFWLYLLGYSRMFHF